MNAATTEHKPSATALAIRASLDQLDGALAEFEAIEAGFAALEAAHPANLACDVTSPKGMREAIAGRAAWRDPRIATEKVRKAGKAPVLALGKDIDARAAAIIARLEVGEANYHEQIAAEETRKKAEAEEKRLAEVKRRERNSAILTAIRQRAFDMQGKSADAISGAIVKLHTDSQSGFGLDKDYKALESAALDETREKLRDMHQAAIEREAEDAARKAEAEALARERAELAMLRQEQEARERAARMEAENARREADAIRAKADAEARALRDAEEARLRAERAEQQARIDAERAELRKAQDEADRAARVAREVEETRQREIRAAEALAQQEREAKERAERIAAQQAEEVARQKAIKEAHEKLEAAHAAEAKGRAAWIDLAVVCEMVLAGEKIAAIRVAAAAALEKAGRA